MNTEEFDGICNKLHDTKARDNTGKVLTPDKIESFRSKHNIPVIARGTLTEELFKSYKIDTGLLSVIEEGYGKAIAKEHLRANGCAPVEDDTKLRETFKELPDEIKLSIEKTLFEFMTMTKNSKSVHDLLFDFITEHGKGIPRNFRFKLYDESLLALSETYTIIKISSKSFDDEFSSYIKNLLTGIYVSLQHAKKAFK